MSLNLSLATWPRKIRRDVQSAARFNRKAANRERRASASTLVAHPGAATINGKRRVDGASSAEEGEVSDGGASHASSSMSKLARKAQNGFDIR